MSHLVIFKNAKNATAFHQASSLDDAVRFMEHLRNTERVEHAKLFKLHEVNFEFRPYYKVEVGNGAPAPTATAAGSPEPEPEPEVDEDETEVVDESEPPEETDPKGPREREREPVGVGSRKGLFGR